MARSCNCAGSTCGCSVTAGTSASVTGIGTAASPFVIGFTGVTQIKTSLTVQDTTTAKMTALGSGTPTDPLVLSVNVPQVPWQNAPASATADGTKGDVAYDATHLYVCIATNQWVRSALATW